MGPFVNNHCSWRLSCWISWVEMKGRHCKLEIGGVADLLLCWGMVFPLLHRWLPLLLFQTICPPCPKYAHCCPQRTVNFPLGVNRQLNPGLCVGPYVCLVVVWFHQCVGLCIPRCTGLHTPGCFSWCVVFGLLVYQFLSECVAEF